ncbi:MAG TPA: EamA family transporter [Halanaerobiales bacterium]|nr:EamA family transporter [Halanaerobiales bacterium]
MLSLFMAILCSSSIALIFKYSEDKRANRYLITSSNYLVASLISLFLVMSSPKIIWPSMTEFNLFAQELKLVLTNQQLKFTMESSNAWAVFIGIIGGIFFFLAFIFYQKSVNEEGVGLAGTFAKLGILIPMILAIFVWNEIPETIQWFGIALALAAILIVNSPFNKDWRQALKWTLIGLFVFGGLGEFMNKFFQYYGRIHEKNLFLFFVFSTAFIISAIYVMIKDYRIKPQEFMIGIFVGIPNLFSSFFLINALDQLKTAVVFPIFSAGSIVVISTGGYFIFGETLNKREKTAIVLTIVALIMINIQK